MLACSPAPYIMSSIRKWSLLPLERIIYGRYRRFIVCGILYWLLCVYDGTVDGSVVSPNPTDLVVVGVVSEIVVPPNPTDLG